MSLRKNIIPSLAFFCFLYFMILFYQAGGSFVTTQAGPDEQTGFLKELAETYGLAGIFVISAASNVVPYSTVPYLFIIAVYAAAVDPVYRILVIVLGGVGAALGKIVVFYIGKLARRAISNESKKNLRVFISLSRRSVALAVFIFAALPLPDDIIYFPLGMTGYSVRRFFVAVASGKIVITFLATAFGASIGSLALAYPLWLVILSLLVITLVVALLVVRINWLRIAEGAQSRGIWEGVRLLGVEVEETFRSFLRIGKRRENV